LGGGGLFKREILKLNVISDRYLTLLIDNNTGPTAGT